MQRSLPSAVLAFAVAMAASPAPSAAQLSSDAMFRSFVTLPGGALALGPLEFASDAASIGIASLGGGSDEEAEEEGASTGWFAANQRYAFGGAAALAAGLALSQYVSGQSADPNGLPVPGTAAAPTNFGAIANLPAGPGLPPALAGAPQVFVNPEPGTVLLLGTGLAGLLAVGRRRRAR